MANKQPSNFTLNPASNYRNNPLQRDFLEAADMIAEQKKQEVTQKYEGLRQNYNELLTSFD